MTDTLDEVKTEWLHTEQRKEALRAQLKELTKKQRPLTEKLRDYMLSNEVRHLDLGSGWSMGSDIKHRVACNVDICRNYMNEEQLKSMVRDNTSSKTSFKVCKPARGTKRPRSEK